MAHSCPDCGSTCYCCGDIDDINFGETFSGCNCCLGKDEPEGFDDDYLMDRPVDEEEADHA